MNKVIFVLLLLLLLLLGAVLSSRSYLEEYVSKKVDDWVGQVVKLAEFAAIQPQACYAAYTFGLKHKWTYVSEVCYQMSDVSCQTFDVRHLISVFSLMLDVSYQRSDV